ncbi:hypothetical protein SCH01S_48_01870 [Sphingomonas changbaiensis NBRC 104936]|uniref:DUF2332 domain-containing protein n=1 Tax=Sphingomonas changbaiensis NBRC 104936 TaxID=1219043 RepID=A0A0E9MTS2_9SPHN|nr:DUF2332 family protein [Sphingomonas changbaiensis]GAO40525.1 hypothetical protein SCH01S_48_01870 [Sphingomonas changbaiensis NBRC 104936]
MSEQDVRDAFATQAEFCDRSECPVTAAVVRGIAAALDRSTETGRRTLEWRGDPRGSNDAVPLRLAGGMHALARRKADARLVRLYAGALEDSDAIVRDVLHRFDAELATWLDSPPQTNETGRAAPIMAGLMVLAAEYGLPFELIELGASAGLNQNLDRFGYRLGDAAAGDPDSPLQLAPAWGGESPPAAEVRIVARRAVDRNPVLVADPAQRERLAAYCWVDQTERMQRLEAALALAAEYPPDLEQGDAGSFIESALAEPQRDGVCRVVFHTIFWQYLDAATQDRIANALRRAGASATAQRPLAWLRFEQLASGLVPPELHLTKWPGGRERHLATGHPHGSKIRWHG